MFVTLAAAILLQVSAVQAEPAAGQTATPAPTIAQPTCDTQAHAAFDFWVGDWEVYQNGTESKVANSKIERLYGGCAIRENWLPVQGAGGSLSNLDPATGRWHQVWIGSSPGRVEFEGGLVDGAMVLVGYWAGIGGPDRDGLVRMTYTSQDGGAVRQYGQVSYDHGATWEDSFDLIYRPNADTPNGETE